VKKVLIVEDDQLIKKALGRRFKSSEDCKIMFAGDTKEAMKITLTESPNIILLDLMLPGGDGFDFLEKIKSTKSHASIPVIVLTVLTREDKIQRAMDLGAEKYLIKSNVSLESIQEILDSSLSED
jgi:DNA-binding response OmpR family regulator